MCQCQSSVTENVHNWSDSNPESFWLIPIIWTHARWQSSQNSQVSIILLYSKLIWYPKSVSINRDCHHHNSIWNVQLVMLGGSVFLQPRPWHTPHISVHGRLCFRQVHLPVLQVVITKMASEGHLEQQEVRWKWHGISHPVCGNHTCLVEGQALAKPWPDDKSRGSVALLTHKLQWESLP